MNTRKIMALMETGKGMKFAGESGWLTHRQNLSEHVLNSKTNFFFKISRFYWNWWPWNIWKSLLFFFSGFFCCCSFQPLYDIKFLSFLQMRSKQWDFISTSAKDLVKKMLDVDPDKRITIDDALNHPWIKVGNLD